MAAVHNFSLDQGSDKVVYFVLRDKSGPIDLSGYSAAMQVRRYAFSEAAIDTLTTCNGRLLIDGPAGKITAKFNHANTEQYPGDTVLYDIELESPGRCNHKDSRRENQSFSGGDPCQMQA